ncbi:MAG: hypothetical protein ACRDZY_20525, partial [Acidimicrobiales bacterium]
MIDLTRAVISLALMSAAMLLLAPIPAASAAVQILPHASALLASGALPVCHACVPEVLGLLLQLLGHACDAWTVTFACACG